jgi:hypothetical protein
VINIHRSHVSIFVFALMLVVISLDVAQERFMLDAFGNMVLCTGDGPETVLVDTDGQPIQWPDNCIDCITNFVSLDPKCQTALSFFMTELSHFFLVHIGISQMKTLYDWPLSRASPPLVLA